MKIWNYIVIFITLFMFLEFVGFPMGFASTLSYFGITMVDSQLVSADIASSALYSYLFGTVGILILAGGAVIIGLFSKSFDVNLILLPVITTVLVKFVSAGWIIVKYAQETGQSWLTGIVAMIFIPFTIGYIVAAVEWFRGTD